MWTLLHVTPPDQRAPFTHSICTFSSKKECVSCCSASNSEIIFSNYTCYTNCTYYIYDELEGSLSTKKTCFEIDIFFCWKKNSFAVKNQVSRLKVAFATKKTSLSENFCLFICLVIFYFLRFIFYFYLFIFCFMFSQKKLLYNFLYIAQKMQIIFFSQLRCGFICAFHCNGQCCT